MGLFFIQPYFYGHSSEEDSLCLAIRQNDHDWSSHVYWLTTAIIHAEEQNIGQINSTMMPLVEIFGDKLHSLFKDAILRVDNYGDIDHRNLEQYLPRVGRNNQTPPLGPNTMLSLASLSEHIHIHH